MRATPVALTPAAGRAAWTALLDRDPLATPFHEWDLLESLARRSGWRFRPLIASVDGEPVGVVPVIARGAPAITPALPLPYVGPLVPAGLLPDVLDGLRRWQRRSGHLYARAAFSAQQPRPAALPARFAVATEPTYVLDLTHGDPEQYARGLRPDRRTNLRRAARVGITSRPAIAGEATVLLPQVIDRAFGRHGDSVLPAEAAITAYVEDAVRAGSSSLITETVLLGDRPVGLLVGARRGETAYGWVGGVQAEVLRTGAGTVAYDAVIRRAIAGGVRRFDLVGHVDEGVARFKLSFGAHPEDVWRVTSSLVPRGALTVAARLRAGLRSADRGA